MYIRSIVLSLWVCRRYLFVFFPLLFIINVSKNGSCDLFCSIVYFMLGCSSFKHLCSFFRSSSECVKRMKQSSRNLLKLSIIYCLNWQPNSFSRLAYSFSSISFSSYIYIYI